jgi:archaellum biogenesis ATPase FlaH
MSWAYDALMKLKTVRIPHRNYESARTDLRAALAFADEGELVHVVGPTGAGKSVLMKQVGPLLVDPAVDSDSHFMPLMTTIAHNTYTAGAFSTLMFTQSAIKSVSHPVYSSNRSNALEIRSSDYSRRVGEPQLRDALIEALKWRRVKYWVIDELQGLMRIKGATQGAANYLDSLKCLAEEAQIRIVILSTYELLHALQLSTHLLRRKMQIHFRRYRADVRDDVVALDQILAVYSELLRFDGSKNLRDWNEYLYGGSFGCIGMLRSWIKDALLLAWTSKAKAIRLEHFEARRRSDVELSRFREEILEGEQMLANSGEADPEWAPATSSILREKAPRPFRRKPKRHPRGNGGIR